MSEFTFNKEHVLPLLVDLQEHFNEKYLYVHSHHLSIAMTHFIQLEQRVKELESLLDEILTESRLDYHPQLVHIEKIIEKFKADE